MLSISHGVSIMAEPHPDRRVPAGGISTSRPDPKGSVAGATVPLSERRSSSSLASCRAGFGS